MSATIVEPVAPQIEGAPPLVSARPETWAASRSAIQHAEKRAMAHHFAQHDFLLQEGANPATQRDTAASFLVNQGTTPTAVAQESLEWVAGHSAQGPFHITWYTPGALLSAALFEFRQTKPQFSAATHLHLFPGTIDLQLQAQIGIEAQEYAHRLRRRFSYMILSGHSFDLRTGVVRFHFDREIPIQRTCALLAATQKFLFFDSQKFTGEGEEGYSLRELLSTCNAVILYTVSSPWSADVSTAFKALCGALLTADPAESDGPEEKTLRLTIVGSESSPSESLPVKGFLRKVPLDTPVAAATSAPFPALPMRRVVP